MNSPNLFVDGDGAAFTSERIDWNTPSGVLELVYQLGPVGLDPCSNANSIVKASRAVVLPEDGLSLDWSGHGLVFVNPPYGRAIKSWVRKCRREGAKGTEVVALVPARPDTRWFQENCAPPESDAVCLWQGRLRFLGAKSSAPFPSALVYWGDRQESFTKTFMDHGSIWFRRRH